MPIIRGLQALRKLLDDMGGGAEGPMIFRITGGFGFNPTLDGEDFPGLDEDQAIAKARARHARFVTIHSDRAEMAMSSVSTYETDSAG